MYTRNILHKPFSPVTYIFSIRSPIDKLMYPDIESQDRSLARGPISTCHQRYILSYASLVNRADHLHVFLFIFALQCKVDLTTRTSLDTARIGILLQRISRMHPAKSRNIVSLEYYTQLHCCRGTFCSSGMSRGRGNRLESLL